MEELDMHHFHRLYPEKLNITSVGIRYEKIYIIIPIVIYKCSSSSNKP